jgi:hypothetical protein
MALVQLILQIEYQDQKRDQHDQMTKKMVIMDPREGHYEMMKLCLSDLAHVQ